MSQTANQKPEFGNHNTQTRIRKTYFGNHNSKTIIQKLWFRSQHSEARTQKPEFRNQAQNDWKLLVGVALGQFIYTGFQNICLGPMGPWAMGPWGLPSELPKWFCKPGPGPMAHGPMGPWALSPWAHEPMDSWAHGPMAPWADMAFVKSRHQRKARSLACKGGRSPRQCNARARPAAPTSRCERIGLGRSECIERWAWRDRGRRWRGPLTDGWSNWVEILKVKKVMKVMVMMMIVMMMTMTMNMMNIIN